MTVRLPADIPIEDYPKPEVFIDEAATLVEEAGKLGLTLRVMGGMGIFIHRKGYKTDPRFLYQFGKTRHIFFGGRVPMLEIFYDQLAMNHTVPYKDRLEKDSPTVPLGELMMQKLQVVKINEKDIKDLIVLIRAHDLGEDDLEKINMNV